MRLAVKEAFGAELWDEVTALLFAEDPLGINLGSNTDEYEPEVQTILPRLVGCASSRDAQWVIHEEFVRWFDEAIAGPPERYRAVAERIWEAWCRGRGQDDTGDDPHGDP